MKHTMLTMLLLLTILNSTKNWGTASSPQPKKILTILPKFARDKGKELENELNQRARQGFFFNFGTQREKEETYRIMARNFGINNDQVSDYIQKLKHVATNDIQGSAGGSSSDQGYSSGGGLSGGNGLGKGGEGDRMPVKTGGKNDLDGKIGFEGGVGNAYGKGTNDGDKTAGSSPDEKIDSGRGKNGTEIKDSGASQKDEKKVEDIKLPEPELLDPEEKIEEKKEEEKKVLKPFEYTLDPLENFNLLSKAEKEQSDELVYTIVSRLMQVSLDAQHTSLKASWINSQSGKIEDIPSGNLALKSIPGIQIVDVPKPKNGFEAQYYIMKEQLIAFVGYADVFKKRGELRDLLGSQAADGTLKKFIDKQLTNSSLDALYLQLIDNKQELLKEWIKLFEPCFFDTLWIKDERNHRVWETLLINTIVARKSSGDKGKSLQIVSDNEVKAVLLSIFDQLLLFVPEQKVSTGNQESPEQEEQEEQSILKNKEDTKKLLGKFLSKKPNTSQQKIPLTQEEKKRDIISLNKDYALELYDQLNRLRVNSHFEKMFAIIGQEALARYDKDQSPLKNNLYPLLLWILDSERVKVAATFREMAKNQLFFNTEDLDIKTIFADLTPWNTLFDYHNLVSKKYRKKVDVVAFINTELKQQKTMSGIRAVVQRLRSIVVEKSIDKVKGLEEHLKSLDVKTDAVVDLFQDIISNENSGLKLDISAAGNLKKLIDDYAATNKKKVAIIDYVKKMKELYEKEKKPITKHLYDDFNKDSSKRWGVAPFKVKELFYDLYRMPSTIYQQFVKIAGKKSLVSNVISEDDFYKYVVPYGMLLKVLEESQANLTMLRNSLNAMNLAVVKAQELYADTISKNNDNKTIIQKGMYKGKLQPLIDAIDQGNPTMVRQAINAYVMSDEINPTADIKYKQLMDKFISNLSSQYMLNYSIMMKVLDAGSAQCPDNAPQCLIAALPLEGEGVTSKEKVRNAHIYKKFAGILKNVSSMFNPGNQPLTAEGLKNFDTGKMEEAVKEALEKIKTALENKDFDRHWVDQNNKEGERASVLGGIKKHFDEVLNAVMQLKLSIGAPVTSVQTQPQFIQESSGNQPPPPPPPNPMDESNEGGTPPPPPPPPPF